MLTSAMSKSKCPVSDEEYPIGKYELTLDVQIFLINIYRIFIECLCAIWIMLFISIENSKKEFYKF